jgi:antitoxin VapB
VTFDIVALNIKDPATEKLAAVVAGHTGESKTAAMRRALQERLDRLLAEESRATRRARIDRCLEEIWAQVPPELLDRPRTGRAG